MKKRKRKPGRSLQLDRLSRVHRATARVQVRKQLHRNGAVTFVRVLVSPTFGSTRPIIQHQFVFYNLPSRGISCFVLFSSLWFSKSMCHSAKDTTTFSFTPLGPCNSHAAIPHQTGSSDKPGVLLAIYIHLHTLPYPARELFTHTKHFAAAGLMAFQEATTGNARPYLH